MALRLIVNDREIPLAQVGPNLLILEDRHDFADDWFGQVGVVIMNVDDAERRWSVQLPTQAAHASERNPCVIRVKA